MDLKKLVEISPIIGSFLIFMGFFKLYFFYGHWDINIINYLDFSEIILSFFNDLNMLFFFTILMFFQSIIGIGAVVAIDRQITKMQTKTLTTDQVQTDETTNPDNAFQGVIPVVEDTYQNHPIIGLTVSLILTILFVILFLYQNQLKYLYFAFVFFIQLILFFLEKFIGIRDDRLLFQLTFVITFVCFTSGVCRYEIKYTGMNPKKVEMYTDKEIVMTSDTILFLGKTNNFYFFFNNIQKKSIVYSASSVQKIAQMKYNNPLSRICNP